MRVTILFWAMISGCLAAPAIVQAQSASAVSTKAPETSDDLLQQAKDRMRTDPGEAVRVAERVERHLMSRAPSEVKNAKVAESLWLQAEGLLRLGDANGAELKIVRALKVLPKGYSRSLLGGDLLMTRGGIATAKADVSEALSDYQTAHNIFRAIRESRKQAIALRQIASLYREAGDLKTALRYDDQSTEIYAGDLALEVGNLNNRGTVFDQLKQYKQAEKEYKKALIIAKRMNNAVYMGIILRNIARVQIESGQLNVAKRTVTLAQQYESYDKKSPITALRAQIYLQERKLGAAYSLITRYFSGVAIDKTEIGDRDAHDTAFRIYRAVHREDLALRHLEALKRLDDKTASLTASANTALMAARFDDANKDAKIANLKAEDARRKFEFEQARGRLLQWIFGGVIIASVAIVSMLIFGLVTIRRSRNEVRAANIDLAGSNAALEKALAAKTEFLATTSHEIRTPLNGILGMTQVMLADRNLPDATRDRLDVVRAAGVTMKALVDDILDVAKMETGNLTVESVPMDLHKTLCDVSRLWEEQARSKGLAFEVDFGDSPQMIQGDPARLRQVVFNLLSNALKFTASGAIGLRVARAGDAMLKISVSDTGIGIPDDKLEEIFESFRQVDAATTRKFGGTGLGLSICRNLARAMGGEVEVASTLGAGSTFTITLPFVSAEQQPGKPSAPMVAADLLIADINPIGRAMLKTMFAPQAPSIEVAGSMEAVLACLATSRPDHLLIDEAVLRAEADVGAALARVARGAGDAPIHILWANPTPADRTRLEAIGSCKVIAKPIAGAELVAAIYPTAAVPADEAMPDLVSHAA